MAAVLLGLFLSVVGRCLSQAYSPSYAWNPDDPFLGESLEEVSTKLLAQYANFPDTTHLLVRLLVKGKKLRKELETKLQNSVIDTEYETQHEEDLLKRITDMDEFLRRRRKGRAVAFSARLTKNLLNIGRASTIVFGSVVTNIGGEYNSQTGKFHCPVDGVYQFFVSILSRKEERVKTELVVNGRRNLLLYSSGDEAHRGSLGMNGVILQLEEGDFVWVRMYHGFGDYIHCCWSTFTGALIKTM